MKVAENTYKVTDLNNDSSYEVERWEQGRDSTDRSAIQECIRLGDTVCMGKVIVEKVINLV